MFKCKVCGKLSFPWNLKSVNGVNHCTECFDKKIEAERNINNQTKSTTQDDSLLDITNPMNYMNPISPIISHIVGIYSTDDEKIENINSRDNINNIQDNDNTTENCDDDCNDNCDNDNCDNNDSDSDSSYSDSGSDSCDSSCDCGGSSD